MSERIVVILGPTATGKSDLGVWLAKKINGEIISADSRQVYRGLTIGSNKISRRDMRGIRHHLLDVASPTKVFTAAQFRRAGKQALGRIAAQGKIPIIVGGTGFYIDALLDTVDLPAVPPNPKLRKNLAGKTAPQLLAQLTRLDPERAQTVDPHNRPRIIRAIEIAAALGHVPPYRKKARSDVLYVGLRLPEAKLRFNIKKRLAKRLRKGLLAEVRSLRAAGISWKRLESFGLDYALVGSHLQGKLTRDEMIAQLERDSWRYAKRQMTWFKKNLNIQWFHPTDRAKIAKLAQNYLQN